jgi:C4-dicarboxylate transporter DctM subunit
MEIFVLFLILIFTIFIGTPVAFALGVTSIAGILLYLSPIQLAQIGSIAFNHGTNMNQLVAPLFILMAEALANGRIASDIYRVINKWLRKFKVGLAFSAILASTIFAALCGSSPATAAAIGRISLKEMTSRGYRGDFAAGVVAAGGTLGIMIPPSLPMVLYGILTETSITKLFMAGILPGLLLSAILLIFCYIRVKLNPSLIDESRNILETTDFTQDNGQISKNQIVTEHEHTNIFQDLKVFVPPILLILVVLGSMYLGITTPTEAAGVGAVGALLLVLFMGRFSGELVSNISSATVKTTSMILFLVFGGMALTYVVSLLGLPQTISQYIINSGFNKWVVITMVYIVWFIMGCLMDPGSMVVLTIPFIFPTLMNLGFDPIWLGVVSTLCVEIGMITPPVGLNLFVIGSISDIPNKQIILGTVPFVIALVVCLIVLTIFPQIATFLPSHM